ncbi:hypothetical protein FB382_004366 [Nocardioides ginsengisegetis]|uniref:Uncharacterized protein n=1 Tax=Nocardioides ginsengisegetis TaxID=661491 RepID=A0A7W3J4G7_9ACTN|nr:hypothetical protein [Nocardioides ginsengisegetis]MBA8806015.1 hypothetical protein [Nocardioides ginsengisegetis]
MTRHWDRDESPSTLTHGEWRLDPKTRVLVWVDAPPVKEDPIACYVCFATIYQSCRTIGGSRTKDHAGRAPRLCRCGREPSYRASYCDTCRPEEHRARARASKRRVADRRWAESQREAA